MARSRVTFTLCGLLALSSSCTCGDRSIGKVPVGPGAESLPRDLKPLPEPPKLTIDPNALPGAGGKLAVVAARPRGPVRGEVRPTFTFSKPVKVLESVEAQRQEDRGAPIARIEPALEGEWRWLGSASVEFVPKGAVPYSTTYRVVVAKGLKALDGSALADDYELTFETPRLELQDLSPERDSWWLRPDEPFKLLFNQPVRAADVAGAVTFEVEGDPVPWKAQVMSAVSIAEERRRIDEQARAEGRRVERPALEGRGPQNQQVRVVVAPEKTFPANRAVTMKLAAVLHGEQGALPIEHGEAIPFRTYGPLEVRSAGACLHGQCPYGPIVLLVTNPVDVDSLKGRVTLKPPAEIDWDRVEASSPRSSRGGAELPTVVLPARLKPGTRYQVDLAAGVKDIFNQATAKPFHAEVATDDVEPQIRIGAALGLVEASAEPRLPVELVNLKSLDVKLWNLTVPELARLLAGPAYAGPGTLPRPADVTETQRLRYAWNQARVHPIELGKAFGGKKTGAVLAELASRDLKDAAGTQHRTIAQVTDLAAHLKVGPKKSLAWVTRLSTGAPVEGAEVAAYDSKGERLWAGKSDKDGFADLPGLVELNLPSMESDWEVPYLMVAASKDGDQSVTADTWASGIEPYEFGVTQGWEGRSPENAGFVFTDRGIYRPGDTVYVKGVVRFREVGELKAPAAGSSVTLTVLDSRGDKVKGETLAVTSFGTFSSQVVLAKESPTGYFRVEAHGTAPGGPVALGGSFRVEEYRAPQFRVDVEADKKALVAGEPLEARAYARYLFGGVMANARVKWSVLRMSTSFEPDTDKGFVFGQETWWWDDREPALGTGFFASGEGVLDAKGALDVKAGVTEAPGEKPYTYTVEAEVEDVNRQTVAGRAEVTVHPAAYYVGLRAPSGFLKAGVEGAVDTLVLDTAGGRAPGRKVDVTISSRTWKSVKKKDATGGFSTLSEPVETQVASCSLDSGDGPVPCKFKPTEAGFYIVRAQVADDKKREHTASVGLYVTGPGFVAWQRNDTDRIDLVADKALYDVGDVAHVLVKSPYPEANALVTVEREGVLDRRPVHLVGSVTTVDVLITEAMVPNVFASALLVRPRLGHGGIETGDDPGRPAVRVGLIKLNVERKTKRLKVSVTADQKDYRPGQEVSVAVDVKDSAGRGAPAEVTLYAVDEAVLQLTAYETPDPITHVFTERPLSVRLGEPLLHLVRQRSYGEKGEPRGGGGGEGEGKGFRHDFRTTAYFNPTLEVGADGRGQARFKLPDNLTTFRIMAVAVSASDRFGSGETKVQVNKPVLALPALPRFARVGDRFEAGVVVHSYGAGAGHAKVTASVEGASLDGPAEQDVELAEGSPREVRFAVRADRAGVARFRFRAAKGELEDGVEESIPIELPTAPEVVATYGDTKTQQVEGVAPPSDVWPHSGGLELTLASTSMGGFQQGMRQLIQYPYGCLEQQSSRLVPFIALREISGQFGLKWPGPDDKQAAADQSLTAFLRAFLFDPLDVSGERDPDKVISATVRSILDLQDPDGSFRYWPDSSCAASWPSVYATLALSRAAEVGFYVPAERLTRAEGYLARVAGGQCHPCEHGCPDETRVFALYVLARAKQPKPSYYPELYAKRNELSLFAQALLADAMAVGGGDRAEANSMLQEMLNHAKESAKGVHLEEVQGQSYATLWQSDTRTTGVVLRTLTDLSPDHPYVSKMAHYLAGVRQGDGAWRTTQEAAFSLMALSEVVRTKERESPDFKASVSLGGERLAEQPFRGRSMEVAVKSLGIDELLKVAGGAKQPLTFQKEGQGVLYYSALLKYVPRQLPTTSLDQGLYVQRWFEPYAGGGQSTKFYAGDLVRVRLRVGTNQERHWAAFEVPLPAGLEPVNTALATTAHQPRAPADEGRGEGYEYENGEDQESGSADEGEGGTNPWAFSFWSPFNHTELRDSKVLLFADHLPPGVHVASFIARATTPGSYLLKPASGALMYKPEVRGRSEGGSFEVVLPTSLSQK